MINAGLAQAKGRSGLSWWAISLLLGPIATLVIVAWPKVRPENRVQEESDGLDERA